TLAAPGDLRERKRIGAERRFHLAATREEATRPPPRVRLVAYEEVDQQVHARCEVGAERGLAYVACLQGVRDSEPSARRLRVVAVLGQPDPRARSEVALHLCDQLGERGHRDLGATPASAAR